MRIVRLAALLALIAAAPAAAHDHGEFNVGTSGPRLGLPAYEVLRTAGAPKEQPSRLEVVFENAMRGDVAGLGTGRAGGRAIAHRAGRVLTGAQGLPTAHQYSTEQDAA